MSRHAKMMQIAIRRNVGMVFVPQCNFVVLPAMQLWTWSWNVSTVGHHFAILEPKRMHFFGGWVVTPMGQVRLQRVYSGDCLATGPILPAIEKR